MTMHPADAVDQNIKRNWDRLVMVLPEMVDVAFTELLAARALELAKADAPRFTGTSARRLEAVWGHDYFGVRWKDNYVWFQEMGISPFLMDSLQGKTVPLWVEDADGSIRAKNPKVETRTSVDGRTQVLIFRKVAHKGQRKNVTRRIGGMEQRVSVPRSYPGAPGRINRRTRPGEGIGGRIAKGNVGVRWRHPGLNGRFFIHNALMQTAYEQGLEGEGELQVAAIGEPVGAGLTRVA